MSPTGTHSTKDSGSTRPELPPNVLIFAPKSPATAEALRRGKMFTRLATTAATGPAQLAAVVKEVAPTDAEEEFCLAYRGGILIFDGGEADADLEDTHHEHFRLVCLALKDAGIDLDVAGCVFDTRDILQAGFQLDLLRPGNVLVIDLMDGDDDDENDDDDDDDALEASLGLLVSGNSGATLS